jgi:hypothetical protein
MLILGIDQESTMPVVAKYKPDACWRKNRLAARILLRCNKGRLRDRDILLARSLQHDPALSNRLLDQALNALQVKNLPT